MNDPYAPPPEGWSPPEGHWPAPPRPKAWTREAAPSGLSLALALVLTATTAWALLRASLVDAVRGIFGDEFANDAFVYEDTFLQANWEWVAAAAVAGVTAVAWVTFVVVRRVRRPEPGTLLPWGITGGLAGIVVGFFLADLVHGWFNELAFR